MIWAGLHVSTDMKHKCLIIIQTISGPKDSRLNLLKIILSTKNFIETYVA